MLPGYHEARHEVRDAVLEVMRDLSMANKAALDAVEAEDIDRLGEAREPVMDIIDRTEKIDNDIVIIFAKYTPEAKDLRELVSYLKMTSSINRIRANINNYIKNMQSILAENDAEMNALIKESLSINRCTVNAFDFALEMLECFDDNDKVQELATRIEVEYSKTDDIYSILEKSIMQKMGSSYRVTEEYFNLLKYIRKNLKIIDRLESISGRVIFARMGGKL
ncbi:MAG: PhoU domain-containing protein [Sulfurimonas sp.]